MADQEDDAMCTKDNYVSPYLLRPPRSYEQVMREQIKRGGRKTRPGTVNGSADHNSGRKDADDVEPRR